jgi:hypothetical protein
MKTRRNKVNKRRGSKGVVACWKSPDVGKENELTRHSSDHSATQLFVTGTGELGVADENLPLIG